MAPYLALGKSGPSATDHSGRPANVSADSRLMHLTKAIADIPPSPGPCQAFAQAIDDTETVLPKPYKLRYR